MDFHPYLRHSIHELEKICKFFELRRDVALVLGRLEQKNLLAL